MTSFVESHTIGYDFGCAPLRSMNHAAVLLRDLPACACRWPFGDPHDARFHWCGKPTNEGSYCEEHRVEACNPEQHVPRIKVAVDPPHSINATSRSASMAILDYSIAGDYVAPHVVEQTKQFVDRNRDALLDYWECKIDTAQLIERLTPA